MRLISLRIIVVFVLSFLFTLSSIAYSVLDTIGDSGEPLGWDNTKPIRYYLDPGPLGHFTNEQAHTLLQEAMHIWENVPTADVPRFEFAGYLPEDINGDNYKDYVQLKTCFTNHLDTCEVEAQRNLQTVIIFDEDNVILEEELCRIASGCPAKAGPMTFEGGIGDVGDVGPLSIVQGMAVFGYPSGGGVAGEVALMVHELGHLLGLDHFSLNQQFLFDTQIDEYLLFLPTMETSQIHSTAANDGSGATLNPDDMAGISVLYPSAAFHEDTAAIKGVIKKSNGSPMMHVNVIARNIEDPLCAAYAVLSGRYCEHIGDPGGQGCSVENGDYILEGFAPGNYTVEVEEVSFDQRMNFAPQEIEGDAEYWNEGDQADEDPYTYTVISLAAGETRENVDIILNRSEVTEDRVKFIPLDVLLANFPLPETTACIDTTVDYAGLIGYEEPGTATTSAAGGCSLIVK